MSEYQSELYFKATNHPVKNFPCNQFIQSTYLVHLVVVSNVRISLIIFPSSAKYSKFEVSLIVLKVNCGAVKLGYNEYSGANCLCQL
jgi:hypothetical protein